MNEPDDKELKNLLQQSIAPVADTELRRDLWADLLKKIDREPAPVAWFDWALLGVLGALLVFFPGAIPALLYHL